MVDRTKTFPESPDVMNAQERALRWVILNFGADFEFGPTRGGNISVRGSRFNMVITEYGDMVGTIQVEVADDFFARKYEKYLNSLRAESTVESPPTAEKSEV